jgi:hypothetical protein
LVADLHESLPSCPQPELDVQDASAAEVAALEVSAEPVAYLGTTLNLCHAAQNLPTMPAPAVSQHAKPSALLPP